MKRLINNIIIAGLTGLIVVTGCNQTSSRSEQVSHSGIPVTVTPVRVGQMINYIELSATSAFLFKAAIKTPATGYLDDILINQGDAVEIDQSLFTIRTKEAAAILPDSSNKLNFSGIVKVKSASAGLISSIDHSKGDYVAEGEQLCQVSLPESFVFILDVPFELSVFVKLNTSCEIVLPDNQKLNGIIKSRFPSMSVNSQTERFIVRMEKPVSLPENLTCKIRIVKESEKSATSLPNSCILTDETMQQFWVMKLINDSVAVKVPVITGIKEEEYVQIIQPEFKMPDLFLASGNYGLGDTVYVKVLNKTGHEQ
jgi:hypothetical protein